MGTFGLDSVFPTKRSILGAFHKVGAPPDYGQCRSFYLLRKPLNEMILVLISKFHRVLNVVLFILGDSLAYEFDMPTFRNTLSVPSSWEKLPLAPPM